VKASAEAGRRSVLKTARCLSPSVLRPRHRSQVSSLFSPFNSSLLFTGPIADERAIKERLLEIQEITQINTSIPKHLKARATERASRERIIDGLKTKLFAEEANKRELDQNKELEEEALQLHNQLSATSKLAARRRKQMVSYVESEVEEEETEVETEVEESEDEDDSGGEEEYEEEEGEAYVEEQWDL
jgi:hypothetical protein